MNRYCSTCPADAEMVYRPSALVLVPTRVPLITTDTAIIGEPCSLVTVPVMGFCWAAARGTTTNDPRSARSVDFFHMVRCPCGWGYSGYSAGRTVLPLAHWQTTA